jgi:hypothetical protein
LDCFYFFGNSQRFAHCRTRCNHCWRFHRAFHSRSFLCNLTSKKLLHEFEILANGLKSGDASNQELSIPAPAARIAKTLLVKSDEVAILAVCEKSRHLYFLLPQALRNVGHIPLSSTSEIVNNFAAVRHASGFEGVRDESLNASAIQRIISAPILAEGKVIGVIQISRKAGAIAEAARNLLRTSWENFWRSASRREN